MRKAAKHVLRGLSAVYFCVVYFCADYFCAIYFCADYAPRLTSCSRT